MPDNTSSGTKNVAGGQRPCSSLVDTVSVSKSDGSQREVQDAEPVEKHSLWVWTGEFCTAAEKRPPRCGMRGQTMAPLSQCGKP